MTAFSPIFPLRILKLFATLCQNACNTIKKKAALLPGAMSQACQLMHGKTFGPRSYHMVKYLLFLTISCLLLTVQNVELISD